MARRLVLVSFQNGHEIVVTSGLRTMEEQAALYAKGRTAPGSIVTNARPGYSYHNYGLAFDIALVIDGKLNWSAKVDVDHDQVSDYEEVGFYGEEIGLEWGGRFKTIVDLPHFQYTFGLTLADLRSGKKPPE
jgi:peptidoglycan L-alanyl-D-glutamate endopeptidase CwlK